MGRLRAFPVMSGYGGGRLGACRCRVWPQDPVAFSGVRTPVFSLIFVAHSLSLNRSCSLFFLAAVRLIVPGVLLFRLLLFRRWILPLCLIA